MRSVHRPLLRLATVLAVLAAACATAGDDDAPDVPAASTAPSASASTSPPPEPSATPVAGERLPGAHWVDSTGLLTHAAPEVGPPDTVLPFVHAVGDWLDAHLDDLQRGGPGRLDDVAVDGLLVAATDEELAVVTSALASPDAPVASARYRLDGSYADATEWLTATVEVTSTTGSTRAATMVFVPGDGGPALVLFGPAEPPEVAS
ncbi:MAG: hypothetical protein KY457_02115 [Actinobacteria bacterium]|nr:hypothetical protein [Actinomycetota bacterium]